MRLFILSLFLISTLSAQVQLRLRSDAAGPRLVINDYTVGSLTTITFRQPHGLEEDDDIFCQSVNVAVAINGYRQVKQVISPTQVTLKDLSGSDIPGYAGTKINLDAMNVANGLGQCGKWLPHSIRIKPSGVFAPNDPIYRNRIFGTGGAWSGTSLYPSENPSGWAWMLNRVSAWMTEGCDGETLALCSKEESLMNSANDTRNYGYGPVLIALIGAISGEEKYANSARYMLNNFEKMRPTWVALDPYQKYGGIGALVDYARLNLHKWTMAYDLLYPKMSSLERATFKLKTTNGFFDGDCEKMPKPTGEATATQGTNIITASGIGTGVNALDPSKPRYVFIKQSVSNRKISDGSLNNITVTGATAVISLPDNQTTATSGTVRISGSGVSNLDGSYPITNTGGLNVNISGLSGVADGSYDAPGMEIEIWGSEAGAMQMIPITEVIDSNSVRTSANFTASTKAVNSIWAVIPQWNQNSCGYLWLSSHHDYGPGYGHYIRSVRSQVTDKQSTTINVNPETINNFRGIPTPFDVEVAGGIEVLRVLSVDFENSKLSVDTRGANGAPPRALSNTNRLVYRKFPRQLYTMNSETQQSYGSPSHNLTHTDVMKLLLTLPHMIDSEEDEEMIRGLELAWNYNHDVTREYLKTHWTAMNGGSSNIGYMDGRWTDWVGDSTLIGLNTLDPPIDIRGDYLKYKANYSPYTVPPWNRSDHRTRMMLASDDGNNRYDAAQYRVSRYLNVMEFLFPSSREAGVARKWLEDMEYFTYPGPISADNLTQHIFYQAVYQTANTPSVDYRDERVLLSTKSVYSDVTNYGFMSSRQNWTPDSDQLGVMAFSYTSDHLGNYTMPGSFVLMQGNSLAPGTPKGSDLLSAGAKGGLSFGAVTNQNGILTSPNIYKIIANQGGEEVLTPKKGKGADFGYISIDGTKSFGNTTNKASKMFSEFIHWIPETGQSYVFINDGIQVPSAVTSTRQLVFYRGDAGSSDVVNTSPADTLTRSGNFVTQIKTMQAVGSFSEFVYPTSGASDDFSSLASSNFGGKFTLAQVGLGTEPNQWLSVLMPFRGTTPPTKPAWSSFNAGAYRGIHIPETSSVIAMFRKDALTMQNGVTYTPPSYSGTGRHLVTGLAPGTYSVSVGGSTVVASRAVTAEAGTLRFDASHGQVIVNQLGAALEITTTSLPAAEVGQPYSFNLSAIGGTPPYVWTSTSLPSGFSLSSGGALTASSPVAPGSFPITFTVTDAASATANTPLTLPITGDLPPGVSITPNSGTITTATSGIAYQFDFSVSGGTTPYLCSASGLPTGLGVALVGSVCRVSGTTSILGNHAISVTATDDDAEEATANVTLPVEPSPSGAIQVTVKAAGPSAIATIRKPGLNANAACEFILRNNENQIVQTGEIPPGGPVRQTVLNSLSTGQTYKFETSCPGDTGEANFISVEVEGTRSVNLKFPPITGMVEVLIEWGIDAPDEQSITAPCSSGCSVTLPGLTRGQVYKIRYSYLDAGEAVLRRSPVVNTLVN